jgi:hypothetical protein
MRRAITTVCCAACKRDAARKAAGGYGSPPKSTIGCRCSGYGPSDVTNRGRRCWPYWGVPNLQVINRDVHAAKCAEEAKYRGLTRAGDAARNFRLVPVMAGLVPGIMWRDWFGRYAASMPSAFM